MKYYLYRHIREDNNEPFYIGIGTKQKKFGGYVTEYSRAFAVHYSNKIWNDIISKTKHSVEILFESDSYDEIKRKEIEFIKLYGRKDLGTGILANMTDGGEGTNGRIVSDEIKAKMKITNAVSGGQKKVYIFNTNFKLIKTYKSAVDCSKYFNSKDNVIAKACRGNFYFKGYFLTYNKYCKNFKFSKYNKPIIQKTKHNIPIREWKSVSEIRKNTKFHTSRIYDCLHGKRKSTGKFHWSYKFLEHGRDKCRI